MDKCLEQEFSVENMKGEEIVQCIRENDFNYETLDDYVHPRYSELEADVVAKKLSNKETIRGAQQVLITWLEKGECNDRNSARFYSLIQECYDYVKKQKLEAQEYVKKVENAQKNLANGSCCMKLELDEIEQVFKIVENHKVWDSFTQDQRKEMHRMKTEILDSKEVIGNVIKEVESSFIETMHHSETVQLDVDKELNTLQARVGSLKSELVTVRQKTKDMQEVCYEFEEEIQQLRSELEKRKKCSSVVICGNQPKKPCADAVVQCSPDIAVQKKMQIISLISTYLFIHPFGVRANDIYLHASKIIQSTNLDEIKNLLKDSPKIFKFSEIDSEGEEKWTLSEPLKLIEPEWTPND